MKINRLMAVISLFLCFTTACTNQDAKVIDNKKDVEPVIESGNDTENELLGITIDGNFYSVPCELKKFLNDGWRLSTEIPYFNPIASEDYYEMKSTLSLTEDGEGIIAGGDIIKLLEKDNSILEVQIANQAAFDSEPKKISDCTVVALSAVYGDTDGSIKLNDVELSELNYDDFLSLYPGTDGWEHIPTNFTSYPEFKVSEEYDLIRYEEDYKQEINVFFNLENTAFAITISDTRVNEFSH